MVVEIPLSKTGKKHAGKYVAIVDDCDRDLAEFNWSAKAPKNRYTIYVARTIESISQPKKEIRIHRIILERMLGRQLADYELPDHINRNGLDNRRENLRLATHSQNATNRKLSSVNTSGIKGVSFEKKSRKWKVYVDENGKQRTVGRYTLLEDAQRVRREWANKLYGGFSDMEAQEGDAN